jgi:hypothetical protein
MSIVQQLHRTTTAAVLVAYGGFTSSQPSDALEVRCLSGEQQAQLVARSAELNDKLGIQRSIDRTSALLAEKEERRVVALDCKRRLESLTLTIGAQMSGCPQKIDQYNFTVTSLDAEMENLARIQAIAKTQLLLERSRWPSCR